MWYFYCKHLIETKILSMLGTGYNLKIAKIYCQPENQFSLMAKISSRKDFVPHDTSRRPQGVCCIFCQKKKTNNIEGAKKTKRLQYYNLLSSFDREQNFTAYHVAFIRRGLLILALCQTRGYSTKIWV